jgi:hypothetical protein
MCATISSVIHGDLEKVSRVAVVQGDLERAVALLEPILPRVDMH